MEDNDTMEVASIEIKKSRGKMVVRAVGLTGRGQKYLKGVAVINAVSPKDPNFKDEVRAAVGKLLDSD